LLRDVTHVPGSVVTVWVQQIHVFEMTSPVYTRALHECVSPMVFVVNAYREYMHARARHEDVAEWNARAQLACTAVQKVRVNAGPHGEAFQTIADYRSSYGGGALAENECAVRNEVRACVCRRARARA
jgi:hypothetical protein